MFTRSRTFVREAQSGEDWESQIRKEPEVQGFEDIPAQAQDSASSIGNRAGPNADRRRRLLEGDVFHCGRLSSGLGKIIVRGPVCLQNPRNASNQIRLTGECPGLWEMILSCSQESVHTTQHVALRV